MRTYRLGLVSALIAACWTALAACGGKVILDPEGTSTAGATGGGGTTTTAPPEPTIEEACAAYWDATCSRGAACAPVSVEAFWGDHATCVGEMTPSCVSGSTAPGAATDAADLIACAMAVAALSCDDYLKYLAGEIAVGACAPSPGTLPAGSGCGSRDQCASSVCDISPDQVCGVCTPGEIGTACHGTAAGCKIGLRCYEGQCMSPGQLGDPCSASVPCSVVLACLGGHCSPLLPPGAKCEAISIDSPCETGSLCNPSSGTCDPYDAAPLGAACGLVDGKIHYCKKGLFCQDNFPEQDTCAPSLADGAPCEVPPSGYDPCDYPSRCVDGSCRYPDATTCL